MNAGAGVGRPTDNEWCFIVKYTIVSGSSKSALEMSPVFDRFISIDWSGRDVETRGVELRVTMFNGDNCRIIDRPQGNRQFRSWTRFACYLIRRDHRWWMYYSTAVGKGGRFYRVSLAKSHRQE